MPLRIELLGGFAVYKANQVGPLPIRSKARIFILLALNAGIDLSRKSIVKNLWPDQDETSARNRLRVALSGLRKQLGAALIDQDGYVRLNLDLVQVDYLSALAQLEAIKDEIDEGAELALLEESLSTLRKELLPQIEESWLEQHQQNWTLASQRNLQRMSDLALNSNNLRIVVQAAEAAFRHDPFDDFHWQAYLRAKSMLGDSSDALRAFGQTQRRLRKSLDGEFNAETLKLAAELKLGRSSLTMQPVQVVHQREAEYFSRLVSKAVENDSEAAMALLGVTGSGIEHTNYSDVSIPILESLVNGSTSRSLNWQRTLFSLVTVKSGLNDSVAVLEYGPKLLKETSDLNMIALTKMYMAFSYLQLRQYSKGIQVIDEGIELMEDAGRGNEAYSLYTNKASLLWHQGHFEEALKLYEISDKAANMIGGDSGERLVGVNATNKGLVHLMKGTPEEGAPYLVEGYECLTRFGVEFTYPLVLPPTGYVRYLVENEPSGIELLIQGLKVAYRMGHVRGQQIALDFACGILAKEGRTRTAIEVLTFAKSWRESTTHAFSIAEQMLVDRILDICGARELAQREYADISPRVVLNKVVQELRIISRQMISS